jgi:hypothetical protein
MKGVVFVELGTESPFFAAASIVIREDEFFLRNSGEFSFCE